jgi:hypothetical protein
MYSNDDSISPQTAGLMMGVIALLGLGLIGLVYLMNQKSTDGLYDLDNPARQTSPQVQMTPDLWKRTGEESPAVSPTPSAPSPKLPELPPVVIKRQPDPTAAEAPKSPPSTQP